MGTPTHQSHFLTKILSKIHKLLKLYEATKMIFIEISNLQLQGNYQMRELCNELCFLSEPHRQRQH